MKKNRLSIIITIILLIVAVFLIFNQTKTTNKSHISDFAVSDTSNITKIFLADKQNMEVILEKQANGLWKVNQEFMAIQTNVEVLLKTMLNLEVKEPVPLVAHNTVIKRMASISTKIEVYQNVYRIDFLGIKLFQHEKLTKTYYVSDPTKDNMGTYMLMENSSTPYVMHLPGFNGFLSSRYSAKLKDWRDHTIFKYKLTDIKSIQIEFVEQPHESFICINNNNQSFSLKSLASDKFVETYDTIKVLDFITSYRDIRFESLLNDIDGNIKDSIIDSQPFHIITITDTTGIVNKVKTFHMRAVEGETDINDNQLKYDLDRFYALINDGKDFTLIQFYVFDEVLRKLSYLTNDTVYQSSHSFQVLQ